MTRPANRVKTLGYLNAIVVKKLSTNQPQFIKYHNIKDQPAPLARFERFVLSKFSEPGAVIHINYYCVVKKDFIRQTWPK